MKKIFYAMCAAAMAAVGCADADSARLGQGQEVSGTGTMSVTLKYDSPVSKSPGDYDFVLTEENLVNDVQVLVFDNVSGRLERSVSLSSVDDGCMFQLPVGTKMIYALINGPDVARVRDLDGFQALVDDLSQRDYVSEGFAMLGSSVCEVEADAVAYPVVEVGRMVARVVLRSVKCNVARQYEGMTVDCVFLGNAATQQTLGGVSSSWMNVGGYMDAAKERPLGLDGVVGDCSSYLYRSMGCELAVGQTYEQPVCMYCHPNSGSDYTCLYILATIGGQKCYYRVPLDKGLVSNVTCAVDAVITNLGAPLPPDGDIQKGEIVATVSIQGWAIGDLYNAEF